MFNATEGMVPEGEPSFSKYEKIVKVLKRRIGENGGMTYVRDEQNKIIPDLARQWYDLWQKLKNQWIMDKNWRLLHVAYETWILSGSTHREHDGD